jgi:diguanylate cyclase (GGDEF)-like protein/PAS domain S-box-containing protein
MSDEMVGYLGAKRGSLHALVHPEGAAGTEAILDFYRLMLETVVAGLPPRETIEHLCRLQEKMFPGTRASVMVLGQDGRLAVHAGPSLSPALVAALSGLRPGARAGSCGNAVHSGRAALVADTLADPRWADLRGLARDHGVRACWSVPVRGAEGKEIGSFALSSAIPRAPDASHRRLLEAGAAIAGIVLQRDREHRTLHDREAEIERLSLAVNQASNGIIVMDCAGRVEWVNGGFSRQSGYTLAEMKGRKPGDLLRGPETDAATVAEMERAWRRGEAFDVDLRNYDRAGRACWFNITSTPLRRADGEIDGFVVFRDDITARRDAENAARLSAMFYAALAETTQFLHAALDQPARAVFGALADRLCHLLGGHALYIGRLPAGAQWVEMLASAGPAVAYFEGLQLISTDPARPEGWGPVGVAIRSGAPQVLRIGDAPVEDHEFAPYVSRARSFGIMAALAATSSTQAGEAVVFTVYYRSLDMLGPEAGALFQRITEGFAAFFDRKAHAERGERTERLRVARRKIQQALLAVTDEAAIYRAIAEILAAETGAAGVDVLVPEGAILRQVAVAGPLAPVIRGLPTSPLDAEGTADELPFPTQVWLARRARLFRDPAHHKAAAADLWREPPLCEMGLVAGWPIAPPEAALPLGVVMLLAEQPEAFDPDQQAMIANILENAGLAIQQVRYRLMIEQMARRDALTGLLNRTALLECLGQVLARSRRTGRQVAIGVLDLDDFKPVNDGWGHAAGDAVLVTLGQRLLASLREADFAARIGGDEFAIVLTDLAGRRGLPAILDRILAAITAPYTLPSDEVVQVGASLGIALYRADDADPETLLRHADAALYESKAQKATRRRCWRIWSRENPATHAPAPNPVPSLALPPHGPAAAGLLARAGPALRRVADDFVAQFYDELARRPDMAALLQHLSPADFDHLRIRQREHLHDLLAPGLTEAEHRAKARRVGRIHALIGVNHGHFLEAMRVYERLLRQKIAASRLTRAEQSRLADLVIERCAVDTEEQLEGAKAVHIARQQLLTDLNAALTRTTTWSDFLRFAVDRLVILDGVAAVAQARPAEPGGFIYEYTAGVFDAYLEAMKTHDTLPVVSDLGTPIGLGPFGRAWNSEIIETAASYVNDPRLAPWRQAAQALGFRASAAVPVKDGQGHPVALLGLYGRYPGMFEPPDARTFLVSLGALLSQARQRLPQVRDAVPLSAEARRTIRASLYQHRLELHYQPVVALGTGRPIRLEALARLRLPDGKLILPGGFLDSLGHAEMVRLFLDGLHQALAQLASWEGEGLVVGVSVNLPPTVLAEPECARWVVTALTENRVAASRLGLEILESEDPRDMATHDAALHELAGYGIALALDDLGSGYSSLLRLSQLPLDTAKIDQGMVREAVRAPRRGVGVIGALVRLAQSLGLKSVIEGLETPEMVEMAVILGADAGQGYALARPMPTGEVLGWTRGFALSVNPAAPRGDLGRAARDWRFGVDSPPKVALGIGKRGKSVGASRCHAGRKRPLT